MTSMLASHLKALGTVAALLASAPAMASDQRDPVDRTDASVISEDAARSEREQPASPQPGTVARPQQVPLGPGLAEFTAGAIRVEGALALPPAAFASAIEPFLGRELSRADLVSLAGAVANAARASGYGLATAWIPQQRIVNGTLRVRIDEGRIDGVRASGPAGPAAEYLLRNLVGDRPVRTAELERQLLLAGDLAGVTLGNARMRRIEGRNILVVETNVQSVEGRFAIDNWGVSAVGPVRITLSVDFNGLLKTGDRLTLGAMTTPLQPREFKLVRLGYSIPFGPAGTRASLRGYYSQSRAGGELRDRDLEGRSAEVEAEISHPLVRSRSRSLWGHAVFGVRDSRLTRADTPAREDRISTVSAILYGQARLGEGGIRGRISLVQGIDAFGATREGDPLASRPDADGTFSKVGLWGEYIRRLGLGFSLQLSAEGQLASSPLLASEEMGLGGRYFLRGYDYREYSGDRGWAGSAEIRFDLLDLPRPAKRLQLYVYGDGGHVSNIGTDSGGGFLASAGGGFRLRLRNSMEAAVELGIPLEPVDRGQERPGPRLSFILNNRF
jgi:hemolysin activation/secretion protein